MTKIQRTTIGQKSKKKARIISDPGLIVVPDAWNAVRAGGKG
jgi:hypothetical protein